MIIYRPVFACVAIIAFVFPVLSQSPSPDNNNEETVYILPFEGVGNIKLYKSKRKEVEKQFGKGSITRSWRHKKYGIGELLKIQTDIYYKDLGLCFQIYRNYGNRTVQTIIIDSTSLLTTPDEIKIGSKIKDVRNSLGDARFMRNIGSYDYSYLYYSLKISDENYSYLASIIFYCFDTIEEHEFEVEEIGLEIIASPVVRDVQTN